MEWRSPTTQTRKRENWRSVNTSSSNCWASTTTCKCFPPLLSSDYSAPLGFGRRDAVSWRCNDENQTHERAAAELSRNLFCRHQASLMRYFSDWNLLLDHLHHLRIRVDFCFRSHSSYYLGRLDNQDGLVRKDAVEVLTPLEDSQQDSEPESQQDAGRRHRPSSSTSTGVSSVHSFRHFLVSSSSSRSGQNRCTGESRHSALSCSYIVEWYELPTSIFSMIQGNDIMFADVRCSSEWSPECV